jgi:hypothetical protein
MKTSTKPTIEEGVFNHIKNSLTDYEPFNKGIEHIVLESLTSKKLEINIITNFQAGG